MRRSEWIAKWLLNRAGVEVVRARRPPTPRLPAPTPATIARTAEYFTDTFAIAPQLGMDEPDLRTRLAAFEWFYTLRFGTIEVGPEQGTPRAERALFQRYMHVFSALLSLTGGSLAGKRVLDVACNAGVFAIQARRAGADAVLGIDASAADIAQATLIRDIAGLDRLDYRILNTHDLAPELVGTFDITFFFGILYHLDEQIDALRRVYAVTNELAVIDTQLVLSGRAMLRVEVDAEKVYHHGSHYNHLAFTPSESAVVLMLKRVGFRDVKLVPPTVRPIQDVYKSGRWGTFIAFK